MPAIRIDGVCASVFWCRFVHRKRLDFFGIEKEAMSGLPHDADVPARIIIRNDAHVKFTFIVLFDGLDHGRLSGEGDIHHVATFARMQPHTVSWFHFDARDASSFPRELCLPGDAIPIRSWLLLVAMGATLAKLHEAS